LHAVELNNSAAGAIVRSPDELSFDKLRGTERSFDAGDLIGTPGSDIDAVFMIKAGLVSVTVPLSDGGEVETAMVGPNGLVGAMAGFGCTQWFNTVVAQTSGSAWFVDRHDLVAGMREHPHLQQTAFRHELWISVQAQQAAACNATHPLSARLSNRLLRAQDLTGLKEFPFTHELMSEMLGAQRVSISNTASDLKQKGLIDYHRGKVSVENRHGLEHEACECYETTRRAYAVIFSH
jgi:CRP-like cAMP-binding protein